MDALEFRSWCRERRWIRVLDRWFQVAGTDHERLDEFCRQFPVHTSEPQSTDTSQQIWDIAGGLARDGQHFFRDGDGAAYCVTAESTDLTGLEMAFRWLLRSRAPDWGYHVYHGSAVERNGRAVVFLGNGGAGKSTLALGLVMMKNYRLIGDDVICISRSPDGRHMLLRGVTLSFKIRTEIFGTKDESRSTYPLSPSVGAVTKGKRAHLLKQECYADSARLCAAVTVCCHRLCAEPRLAAMVGPDAYRWQRLYHWCEPDHPACSEQALEQFWAGADLDGVSDSLLPHDLRANVDIVDAFLRHCWHE
jgi:hypothetical protein